MHPISDFYGKVSRCRCTNHDPETPMPCPDCFCRGYVAQCLRCMGSGMFKEPVAGAKGEMQVTCGICGGKGKYGVNKPKDWDVLNPPPVPVEASTDAGSVAPISPDSIEVHGSADTVNPADSTWKQPPPKTMHMHNTPIGEPVTSII